MNEYHVRPNHEDHPDFREAMKAYKVLLWYLVAINTTALLVLFFTH